MKRGVFSIIAILIIVSAGIALAGFNSGDPNDGIQSNYAQSDLAKGWINISLDNENSNSELEDNFGNSIKLMDLLNLNSGSSYSCLPTDCKSDYSYSNPQLSRLLTIGKNEGKILGFVLTGNNFESVSSFSAKISSNAPEDSSKQLFLDLLQDDSAEWQSYKASNNFYDENYGCFDNSTEESFIYNQPYCEKINIPISPNVEIGAYITKVSGNATLVLSLQGINSGNSGSCEISASSTGRISCVPNYKINSNEGYYVCIKTKSSSDDNKFKIESETTSPCGYASTEDNKRDFKIFAKPGRFAQVGTFSLNNSESQNSGGISNLGTYISNYVIERYGNNCSMGCIVPLGIISQYSNQQVNISNISIVYVAAGTPKEEKNIYDIGEIPAVVSSGFQKISIDKANFSISGNAGENKTYSLSLNGNEILSKEISFSRGVEILSLSPKTVVAGFPTKFTAAISNPSNLSQTRYEWDFGDNGTLSTNANEATYTYGSLGVFQLKLKAISQDNSETSKTFTINVNTPKDAVNSLLKEKLDDLGNVNSKLNTLGDFQKTELKRILKTDSIESDLTSLQQRNSTAQTDGDYIKIMNDLVNVSVPKSVFESGKADFVPFSTNAESINLDVIKEAGSGGDYAPEDSELYKDAVVSWNIENINSQISFDEFSAQYDDSLSHVLNTFSIKISENPNRGNFYAAIKKLSDLEFKENYGQREALGYEYIKLDSQGQDIEFSTTENIGFSELPVFFSPEIRDLSIVSPGSITSVEDKSKTLLVLVVLFVAILGFAIYIFLQEWYKRRYEDYLFKNKNNLFNIVSYIQGSKKKGIKNEDIAKGLKKAGWSSEQITYVMKKYAGERTGMFEIPVEKIIRLFSKGQETFKNGQNPRDIRK